MADAADFLLRERRRSVEGLDGTSGLAYRDRVSTTSAEAEMLSRCVARLGRGLVELADAIDEVRARMDRARRLVDRYDLVHGDRLEEPVAEDSDDPHVVRARWLAYRAAADVIARARKLEGRAQDDWRDTVAAYAIELGEEQRPGVPRGSTLPPVADAPAPGPGPRERPRPTPPPGSPPESPLRADPVPPRTIAPPSHGPEPGGVEATGSTDPGPGRRVLVGTVLDLSRLDGDPVEPLAQPVLGGHFLPLEPPGTAPGPSPHPEVPHVPCPPDA